MIISFFFQIYCQAATNIAVAVFAVQSKSCMNKKSLKSRELGHAIEKLGQ